MSKRQLPCPDDFAGVAGTMSIKHLVQHYRCSAATVARWLGTMTPEWQAARFSRVEQSRLAGAARGAQKVRQAQTEKALADRPADFAAIYVAAESIRELARQFGKSPAAVNTWIKYLPENVQQARADRLAAIPRAAPRPAAAHPRRQSKPAAASLFGLTPGVTDSVAARAAEHLKRTTRILPIFDAGKVYGKPLAGIYIVGTRRMPTADMIALAHSKGFDQNEWRRVA